MSITQTQLEELVVKLTADPGNHEAITNRFLQNVNHATTKAQGHADEYSRHMQKAYDVTLAVATPIERFGMKVEELDDLMRLGLITQETYNRNFDALRREANQAAPAVDRVGDALKRMQGLGTVGAGMSLAITAPLTLMGGLALKTASDAEESLNKFDVIFGPVLDQANMRVKELDKTFGLTDSSARKMMSGTGDLLKGFGFSAASALDLSQQVQKLSVDVASFSNVEGGAVRVSEAMTKAMLGEREMLKEMGIAILEEDVKLEMLRMKKEGLTFATERQAKAQATLNIALDQSAHRIGDFANTEASFANQTRMLTDEFWELVQLFGREMIPTALDLTTNVLRPMIDYLTEMSPAAKQVTVAFLGIAAAAGPVLVTVASIAGTTNALVTAWPAVQSGAGYFRGLASNAGLARAGVYALGTYLAYEGLKSVLGYNAALKDQEAALKGVADITRLINDKVRSKDDAKFDSILGIGDPTARQAALKAYKADLDRIATDKKGNVAKLEALDLEMQNSGTGERRLSRWWNGMDADIKASIDESQRAYVEAKQRIMQVDAELAETRAKIAAAPQEAQGEAIKAMAGQALDGANALFADFVRVTRGGLSSEEKDVVRGAASHVASFVGEALANRMDKGTSAWMEQLFASPGRQLGNLETSVINLQKLATKPLTIEFKSNGLKAIMADSFEFWETWAKQSQQASADVQGAMEAPQNNAAAAAAAGAGMVGGGGFGALLFGGMAGNMMGMGGEGVPMPKSDSSVAESEKAKAKEAVVAVAPVVEAVVKAVVPDDNNSEKTEVAKRSLDMLARIADAAPFVVRVAGGPGW